MILPLSNPIASKDIKFVSALSSSISRKTNLSAHSLWWETILGHVKVNEKNEYYNEEMREGHGEKGEELIGHSE